MKTQSTDETPQPEALNNNKKNLPQYFEVYCEVE